MPRFIGCVEHGGWRLPSAQCSRIDNVAPPTHAGAQAAEKAAAGKKAAKSSKTAALERELTKEELDAQAAAEKKLVKEMAKLKMNREAKQERDLAKMELKARKREKKKEQDKWDAIKR